MKSTVSFWLVGKGRGSPRVFAGTNPVTAENHYNLSG
jgi:hypothetical protein